MKEENWEPGGQLDFIGMKFDDWVSENDLQGDIETLGQIDTIIDLIRPMSVKERYEFFQNWSIDSESVDLPDILQRGPTNNTMNDVMYHAWKANRILAWEVPYRSREDEIRQHLQSQQLPDWTNSHPVSSHSLHCNDGEEYWEPTLDDVKLLNSIFEEKNSRIYEFVFFGGRDEWDDGFDAILPPAWYVDVFIFGSADESANIDEIIGLAREAGFVLN